MDLVGNCGWAVYESLSLFGPIQTPGGNTSTRSIDSIFPVIGYPYIEGKTKDGSTSIRGFVFHATFNSCIHS